MAVYLTLTFVCWGMIIVAFLLMFHWLRKDLIMITDTQEKRIHALEQKVSLMIRNEEQAKKGDDWLKAYR